MKSEALELVKEIVEAPSCFPALREKGEALLAVCGSAAGSAGESTSAGESGSAGDSDADALMDEFLVELEKDVEPIEGAIAFFKSDMGLAKLGEHREKMLAKSEKAQAEGEKICICPACQAGAKLLDMMKK